MNKFNVTLLLFYFLFAYNHSPVAGIQNATLQEKSILKGASIPNGVKKLMKAYPDFIVGYESNFVMERFYQNVMERL
jgi:hypothetical protein